ncbi:MAG: prenyltransferase [Spirochaetes bacterium]|nr:prenyltransferase [Spirochaetota bacterium]
MRLPFEVTALIGLAFDPRAWKAWWKALRPASLVIALVSCGLGAALAWRDGRGDLVATVLVLVAGMVLQAGVNLVNDFFEFKSRRVDDKIAHLGMFGPERQLVEWFIFLSGLACFAAVVPAGLYLAWRSGWPFAALGAAGLIGGYAYTGEPLNYKRRGLGVPLVFFLMGMLLVAGSYYAVARALPARIVLISLPVSALVSLILLANELRDYEPDGRHGIRTLTVRIGYRTSVVLYLVLLASAYLGTGALGLAGIIPHPLLMCAAIPFAVPPTVLVFRAHERRQGIIPRVMLHHLVFGGLYTAAFLIPFTGGSA